MEEDGTVSEDYQSDSPEYFKIPPQFRLSVDKYHELALSQKDWPAFVEKVRIFDLRHLMVLDSEDTGILLGMLDGMADDNVIMYRRNKEFFSWVVLDEPAYVTYCGRENWLLDLDPHCRVIVRSQD